MSNPFFQFKQFIVWHQKCAMKVGTDGVLLGAWVPIENASSILDIGTGTGLLALMMAQKSDSPIDAIEIDPDACLQAQENIRMSPWFHQICLQQASFQNYYISTIKQYDLIISNPPYFHNSLKTPDKNRAMARHSDSLPCNELLRGVKHLLTDTGRLCVILPFPEAKEFIVEATLCHLYCNKEVYIKPSVSKKIHRVLLQFSRKRTKLEESEIIICDATNKYTEEYRELTRDYYLNF